MYKPGCVPKIVLKYKNTRANSVNTDIGASAVLVYAIVGAHTHMELL